MCIAEILSKIDFKPGKECMNCPVDKECTELILLISARCWDIIGKLREAGEKLEGMIQEH